MLIDPNAERQNPRPGSGAIPHGLQTTWVYVRGSLPQTTVLPIMVSSLLGGVIAARTIRVRRMAESSDCRRFRSAAAFSLGRDRVRVFPPTPSDKGTGSAKTSLIGA